MKWLVIVAALVALAAPASAAKKHATPAASPTPAGKPIEGTPGVALVSKPPVGKKPARTLVFDPLEIQGRIERPRPIHLLERSKSSFGALDTDEDFLPRIVDSVEGDPF